MFSIHSYTCRGIKIDALKMQFYSFSSIYSSIAEYPQKM